MPKFRIPEELRAQIQELHRSLQGEPVDLTATPAGRDILDLAAYLETVTTHELSTFSHLLGADYYHARALSFWQQKRGKRLQWQRGRLEAALAEYFGGSIERLDDMLLEMTREREEPTTAIWVHPVPIPDTEAYFVYIMHHSGLSAGFQTQGRTLRRMNLPHEAIRRALEAILRPRPRIMAQWAELVAEHADVLSESMRADVTAFLERCGSHALNDEQWKELVELVFYREESVSALQTIIRRRSQSWVIESQNLMNVVWQTIDRSATAVAEKINQIEKQSAKQEKRLRADLDKYRSLHDIAAKRVNQLTRENHKLHKQMEQAGTDKSQEAVQGNLGAALDRFFGAAG